jgi:uncharacterized Ntn-hydrolase superfamily protein
LSIVSADGCGNRRSAICSSRLESVINRTLMSGLIASLAVVAWCAARAQGAYLAWDLPVHTYSIVARDAATGQLGVAVQSHNFSVGTVVPWAEAGVGAVAVQSIPDLSYGKLGLDFMRAGKSAPDALRSLLAGDDGRDLRQVAMIDARGRVAGYTGSRNIPEAGHEVGANFAVQANLMVNDQVWPAMARAFENATGPLAERMLAALDAGQAAGGDIRGKQSAAIVVVSGTPTGNAWVDRVVDLRVDDSTEPLKELRRLLVLRRAYDHVDAARQAQRNNDNERALTEYRAASTLAPDNAELMFWHAVALVRMKRMDDALPLFRRVFVLDKAWAEVPSRLARAGLLPGDSSIIQRIVEVGK